MTFIEPGVPDARKEAVLQTMELATTPVTVEEIALIDRVSLPDAIPALTAEERAALRHAAYRLQKLEHLGPYEAPKPSEHPAWPRIPLHCSHCSDPDACRHCSCHFGDFDAWLAYERDRGSKIQRLAALAGWNAQAAFSAHLWRGQNERIVALQIDNSSLNDRVGQLSRLIEELKGRGEVDQESADVPR